MLQVVNCENDILKIQARLVRVPFCQSLRIADGRLAQLGFH